MKNEFESHFCITLAMTSLVIFAQPLTFRKFWNKTELPDLRCPNCENYADAFHYYYVHPFRNSYGSIPRIWDL